MSAYVFLAETLSGTYDVDPDAIHPQATLADLGLDSLTVVELLFDVEDELGITIPEGVTFQTLAEAAALMDDLVRNKGT
ncbi:MAG: acyl carrier protein [Deltaproteobacteria bacterium]|nr:acyl carrier protein [Deltaproteobacteria bacterium]